MTYNLSGFENATNPLGMVTAMNDASSGLVGIMFILAVFIVLLMALIQRNPAPEAFFASSLVSTLLAVIFVWVGLLSWPYVVAGTIILVMAGIALYRSNSV